jgi:hypothetical protein
MRRGFICILRLVPLLIAVASYIAQNTQPNSALPISHQLADTKLARQLMLNVAFQANKCEADVVSRSTFPASDMRTV